MFLITNREVKKNRTGFDAFGKRTNRRGPHELRLVEVTRSDRGYDVKVLEDTLNREEKLSLGLPVSKVAYRSQLVARDIYRDIRESGRNLLLFVHGYNNNVEAVVERAYQLQDEFSVKVVPFSWPANGGGAAGALDYKSDKKDARASIGALDRVLDMSRHYLKQLREEELEQIRQDANERFADDAETRDEFLARTINQQCPFRVSLMLHSMGNYLFKQLLKSTLYSGDELIFDNVVLVAADTNNRGHKSWIDRVEFRNRMYVTINENDSALRLSRMKSGSEQKARLGHYPYELDSRRTVYVDVTESKHVGDSHAYFEGDALQNASVKDFFKAALNGEVAERDLDFNVARNLHRTT